MKTKYYVTVILGWHDSSLLTFPVAQVCTLSQYTSDDMSVQEKHIVSENNVTGLTLHSIITPFYAFEMWRIWKYYGKWSKCSIFHYIFKS